MAWRFRPPEPVLERFDGDTSGDWSVDQLATMALPSSKAEGLALG